MLYTFPQPSFRLPTKHIIRLDHLITGFKSKRMISSLNISKCWKQSFEGINWEDEESKKLKWKVNVSLFNDGTVKIQGIYKKIPKIVSYEKTRKFRFKRFSIFF